MRILPLQKLLSLIVMLCATVIAFAQPANDDCSTPTPILVGADAASCIPVTGDTRGTVDATTVTGPLVCSGTWFTDDVWFSFDIGAEIPPLGVTVEVRVDPNIGTDFNENGMGVYEASCDAANAPIDCYSNQPGRRTISLPPACLVENSTYLVRVWSAGSPTDNAGTFAICAYESAPSTTANDVVIYEETFSEGLNDWTVVTETTVGDPTGELTDDWIWLENDCIPLEQTVFNGIAACLLPTETLCQTEGLGAVGMPGSWYEAGRTDNPDNVAGVQPIVSYLVSPPIDLSAQTCVNLQWLEVHRGFTGSGLSRTGPTVEYSIDGGDTWLPPTTSVLNGQDVSSNYGADYQVNVGGPTTQRQIPLIGAEGNADVRIRFGWVGSFYYWVVDNIRIVEGTTSDIIAQPNFFARSHINPMSVHQTDSFDFLIDVANLACEDQTNVNMNVTAVNSAGEVVHDVDLFYGDIISDSLAENQPFLQPFTPPAVPDTYTITYTATSDADDDLSNNVRSFPLEVNEETVFRKENGVATGFISPNTNPDVFWAEGEPFAWEMGNMFYAPNSTATTGEQLRFTEVSFALANPEDLVGELLRVWVYKISDNDFDRIVDKDDSSEFTRLGISEYTVTGMEDDFINVQIFPFLGDDAELDVEAGTHYMAAIESTTETANGIAMQILDTEAYDYLAAIFNARENAGGELSANRYAHAFAISKENYLRVGPSTGPPGDLSTGNFSEALTPLIRLGYTPMISSTVEINNNVDIQLAPNPASSNITVDLSINDPTDMEVSIVNLSGQVLLTKSFDKVTELRENFDTSNLASGIYMIHINTEDGVQTKKFVVSQ